MSIVKKQIDAMLRGMLSAGLIAWEDVTRVARNAQYEQFKDLDGEDILHQWYDEKKLDYEGIGRGMQFLYGTEPSKPEVVVKPTEPAEQSKPKVTAIKPKQKFTPINSVGEYPILLPSRSSGRRPIPAESQKRIAALRLEDWSDTAISRITGIPAATVSRYRDRTGLPNGSKRLAEVGGDLPLQVPQHENPHSQPEVEELQLEEATPALPVVEEESSDYVQHLLETSDEVE